MENPANETSAEINRLLDSARRLGVEIDEQEAAHWLGAIASARDNQDVVMDVREGVFGHRISMLDFSPARLAHFRKIAKLVEFGDEPGVVETALALSGSAAQSRIQTFPGDADFFERVNILAPTRVEACQILARIMREKAMSSLRGAEYQLIEVKFGSYPKAMVAGGRQHPAGSPIAWRPAQIQAGQVDGTLEDGSDCALTWEEAINSKQDLSPKCYAWDAEPPTKPGKDGRYPVAMPGLTPFV